MLEIPMIPIAKWADMIVEWLRENAQWFFEPIKNLLDGIVTGLSDALISIPPILFIIIIVLLTIFINKKKLGLPIFSLVGLLLIENLGYWKATMLTLSLILTASSISILIGVPLGIWMSKNKTVQSIVTPILDFMQTMPAFVYLIPAVSFFGIGMVPGIIASVIFAMPPVVRLTNLGIRGVSTELIEAANAFGSTPTQKLFKVQLPLAKNTIMAGVNQTIMLSLSMVVIASMIGAEGLGVEVFRAVTRNEAGQGFASGLAIVILAMILDRITQSINTKKDF
ncbi:ABC transporter permease [Clostridium gasigenes]|uniref:Glycine betaine/proline transport system permease protein n=1 Tax=Clostridium gasigenes TaxID=94869 RepID=A0A1H0LQP6_9CLOT|nr:proline/glycine betaine ABC transporter permease [Clostridium gasigenes]MBB6622413.1 proline/glycine betaine ABC transporter permease [Clostridium gasigenes]MBB6713923.1 proline/glycine betaine ABC transporter permease [Clostridium gasigenes]MBU3087184.1 proline/glycine betaine ABC transporter permease [Clostridium gasigenes]NKF07296.1 proline/glycine betaine ABC transporter permease [Clostridium gasigenes]QSW18272.1 proline/glycine betaine ABC transporter permease [Clostridium gasigenes]